MSPDIRAASADKGILRYLSVPALPAGTTLQYTDEVEPMRSILRRYWMATYLLILNDSAADIAVDPDYSAIRRLFAPAGAIVKRDDEMFVSFNIVNLSVEDVAADVIRLEIGNQRPDSKGARIIGGR
ncbi:hypothetical protein ES707_11338 [subsurface metagenome]